MEQSHRAAVSNFWNKVKGINKYRTVEIGKTSTLCHTNRNLTVVIACIFYFPLSRVVFYIVIFFIYSFPVTLVGHFPVLSQGLYFLH